MSEFFLLKNKKASTIKAAIFDFDGTLSTLRYGWEEIMSVVFGNILKEKSLYTDERVKEIHRFIGETTGIQTIFQMEKFCQLLTSWDAQDIADPWYYKDLYNKALMVMVKERVQDLLDGKLSPEDFRIAGSIPFLQYLKDRNIELFIASGTDHEDVVKEVASLGFDPFFNNIAGAPHRKMECPKKSTFLRATKEFGYLPEEIVVVGDGKVEMMLADEHGSWALAVASDEAKRQGIDPIKKERLEKAGSWALVGDFLDKERIFDWLSL